MRKYFTNPYKLHEYDLVLKILKDFEVIQHNRIDRLIIGKAFYTYKNLKVLTNNGQSNIIGVIKDSMIKHIKEIIIGNHHFCNWDVNNLETDRASVNANYAQHRV
jgi:hypothetical protein